MTCLIVSGLLSSETTRLKADGDDSVRHRFARHPIIEDDVVIQAGATVFGRVTIGRGAAIGSNVGLLHDVSPGSLATQGDVRPRTLSAGTSALGEPLP